MATYQYNIIIMHLKVKNFYFITRTVCDFKQKNINNTFYNLWV